MLIIGFGIFVLEIIVFVIVVLEGSFGIVLGNVFGFNIVNIVLILGIIVFISFIVVCFEIICKELFILLGFIFFVVW